MKQYHERFGFYPKEVLSDKIYCTRLNSELLKVRGIKLIAKLLGRPPEVPIHLSPGERNPIEGKFGQAKTVYGLDRIRTRLQGTTETWIASIILVLNLVKLAGLGSLSLLFNITESFSALTRLWVENQYSPFSAPTSFLHVTLPSESAA